MDCARCKSRECREGKDCTGFGDEIKSEYKKEENSLFMKTASWLEGKYYGQLTRLEEIALFAKKMGFDHIGVAFCIGFSDEAEKLVNILKPHFKVTSAVCKICGIEKGEFDLQRLRHDEYDTMCNPLGQAEVLNRAGTQLNILMGLCVGHDMLFTRASHAPVTVFAVKDRVLAHNPLGVLYSGYYNKKLENLGELFDTGKHVSGVGREKNVY